MIINRGRTPISGQFSMREQDWAFQCAMRDAVKAGKETITWIGPYTKPCTRAPKFWPRGARAPIGQSALALELFK